MKLLAIAIFLCLAFSAPSHAAQRKIAYEHRENIFVADTDGTHQKKIATGALPEISPDGTRVAFNTEADAKARPGPERHTAVADLDNIYQIDLDGNVLKKWELSTILTDASMNGGDRLSVSPDGKVLLMDVDCGSEHERKNWDGPQPAIEKFDVASEKAVRVTGKDDFVWEPFWLSNEEFLCILQKENENEPSLYRMPLTGKNPKLLAKHARTPSVSAP